MKERIINTNIGWASTRIRVLYLGIDSNTNKSIILFRIPSTDEVEARAYSSPECLGNYEEIKLTTSQKEYAINMLRRSRFWN